MTLSAEFYDAYLWDLARLKELTLYWFLPGEKQHLDHCNQPVVMFKHLSDILVNLSHDVIIHEIHVHLLLQYDGNTL